MPITLHTDDTEVLPDQTELMAGRERDETQQAVDLDVARVKHDTATAGWPAHDPKKLFHRYVVGADDKTAIKQVIRRAGTLHKVEPVFYKDGKTEAGHIVVKFHVARKPVTKDGEVVKGQDGKPTFVPDDTLDDKGKPKGARP